MKIKLSKSQWEQMGKKSGWMSKEAAVTQQFPATINVYGAGNAMAVQPGGVNFSLEIEMQIGGNTIQVPIPQHIPEVQEIYQAIAAQTKASPQASPQAAPQAAPQPVQASYRVTKVLEACSTCPTHKEKKDSGKKDSGKKDWNPNPWAVCHTTVDKKKDPAKYERCVQDVKKKQ